MRYIYNFHNYKFSWWKREAEITFESIDKEAADGNLRSGKKHSLHIVTIDFDKCNRREVKNYLYECFMKNSVIAETICGLIRNEGFDIMEYGDDYYLKRITFSKLDTIIKREIARRSRECTETEGNVTKVNFRGE